MKTKWKLILISFTGMIILTLVLFNLTRGLKTELLEIQPQTIANTFLEEGKVIPQKELAIPTVSTQEIIELPVKEGQVVKKDTVLAVLDTTELNFQLKQLQAQLLSIKGEQTQTFLEQYEAQVKNQNLQIEKAQLELKAATTHLKRIEELYNAGAVTKKELEDAQQESETLRINLREQEENLRVFEESHNITGGTTQYYTGRLKAMEAKVEHLEYQIAKSTIKAPFEGVVANLVVKKGDLPQIGTPLMTLFEKDSFLVEVFVLAGDISKIAKGLEVNLIQNQNGQDIIFSGTIKEIAPSAIEQISALGLEEQRVKVLIDFYLPPNTKLFPGYQLDVEFTTEKRENELIVPKTVLFPYEEDFALWVVKNNKAKIQPVVRGFETDKYVVIKKGLSSGDLVILNPQLVGLKEGKKVRSH